MFNEFIGKEVRVIVETRADAILKYEGIIATEDEYTLTLKNVTIKSYITEGTKKYLANKTADLFEENLELVSINKNYIISCNI